MTPLQADALKFLQLLLSECGDGHDSHEWRRCLRCLAFNELQNQQPFARRMVGEAIEALKQVPGGGR